MVRGEERDGRGEGRVGRGEGRGGSEEGSGAGGEGRGGVGQHARRAASPNKLPKSESKILAHAI